MVTHAPCLHRRDQMETGEAATDRAMCIAEYLQRKGDKVVWDDGILLPESWPSMDATAFLPKPRDFIVLIV